MLCFVECHGVIIIVFVVELDLEAQKYLLLRVLGSTRFLLALPDMSYSG